MQEQELFPEREIELDQPELRDEQADALRAATERAERAEAELTKLKNAQAHRPAAASSNTSTDHGSHPIHGASDTPTRSSDADLKSPPSPSTREARSEPDSNEARPERSSDSESVRELRNDAMMAHLLDSLEAGKDIGHYGRLTFAMVARHFMPHDEVLGWLTRDRDFSEEQANLMLRQVEGRDYSPPRRDRILEWQSQQEFPIIPNPDDPDAGNLYRNLKFPNEIYQHIGHYQEEKLESRDAERRGEEDAVQF